MLPRVLKLLLHLLLQIQIILLLLPPTTTTVSSQPLLTSLFFLSTIVDPEIAKFNFNKKPDNVDCDAAMNYKEGYKTRKVCTAFQACCSRRYSCLSFLLDHFIHLFFRLSSTSMMRSSSPPADIPSPGTSSGKLIVCLWCIS